MTKRILLNPEMRGSLSSFGYAVKKPAPERRAALRKASLFWGPLYVIRKLGAVAGLQTRTHPQYSETFRDDQHWVSGQRVRNEALKSPNPKHQNMMNRKRAWREMLQRKKIQGKDRGTRAEP